MTHPAAIPYALFLAGGPALAIPLAVVTAWPALGSLFARIGIGRLPEETAPPAELLRAGAAGDRDRGADAAASCGLTAMLEGLRTARGIVRSLRIYYGDRRARGGDGPALRPLRAARRSRVRCRRPCRRPRRRRSAGSARAWSRSSRSRRWSRCSSCSTAAIADVAIEAVAVGRSAGTIELDDQCRQSDGFDRVATISSTPPATRPAGKASAGPRRSRVPVTTLDALIARARHAGLHQDRRRGLRGRGAGRADAAGQGAVVRIHHHPARRGARLHRTLHRARLRALQRRARRKPDACACRLGRRRRRSRAGCAALPHAANSGDIYAALA